MAKSSYHHGDLKAVILKHAAELVAERGADGVSLRELARAAGVSHAAPAHHFTDRRGLFTALAAEGWRLLAAALADARPAFADAALAYVRFALKHPGHYAVMFDRSLVDPDDPELVAARDAAAPGALEVPFQVELLDAPGLDRVEPAGAEREGLDALELAPWVPVEPNCMTNSWRACAGAASDASTAKHANAQPNPQTPIPARRIVWRQGARPSARAPQVLRPAGRRSGCGGGPMAICSLARDLRRLDGRPTLGR